jgi:hypothetical protein
MAAMRIALALISISLIPGAVSAQAPKAAAGPCGLVTKAEIQEVLGASVSDGVANSLNKAVCDYKSDGGVINLTLTPKTAADNAERTVAELKKRNIKAEVVPGFGESAYAASPGYGMQQLGVYKGTSQVIVTVMFFGKPEAKAREVGQAIMRKALPRVP